MFKKIPRFDGENFVDWTRSLKDILQIAWYFLSKIEPRLGRSEPIFVGNREGERKTSDLYDNNSSSSDVSGHGSGKPNGESQNSDDIKA